MIITNGHTNVTRGEFMQLQRDVAELKKLIEAQKECSCEPKVGEDTRKVLLARAKEAGITGADRMGKDELKQALGE